MICPRCNMKMVKRRVAEFGPTVEIDYCIYCQGRWLDRGEYETLVRQAVKLAKGETR